MGTDGSTATATTAAERGAGSRTRYRIAAGVVGFYGLLLTVLVFVIYGEEHQVNYALLAFGVIGLLMAAGLAARPINWMAWAAAAYSLVALAADAPFQFKEFANPTSTPHTVSSAVLVLVGVAAVVTSAWAALTRK